MKKRLDAIPYTDGALMAGNSRLWDRYLSDASYINDLQAADQWPSNDEGWIQTTWHQSSPYNNLCPRSSPGGARCIVGCVATAMAQVLNFHKYPVSITLDDSDDFTTDTLGINIDNDSATLDFPSFSELNNMLSNINYFDSAESHAPALSFACAIVTEMDMTPTVSGTWFYDDHFLVDFGYLDAWEVLSTNTDFYTTLIEDMQNRRPALISIYNAGRTSGHAIVVDGYRSTGHYHLNYGWGSTQPDAIADAWYSLPDGMPAGYVEVYNGILKITSPQVNPYNKTTHAISYPNPFRLGNANSITIAMPTGAAGVIDAVKIYTVTGNLVKEINGGDIFVQWNGENSKSKICAPGFYFYSLRTDEDEKFKGKLTILP
ncbi:C10 family peptidase [Elusimicrobiota bacterium]